MTGGNQTPDIDEIQAPFQWRVRLSDKEPHKLYGIVAVAIVAFLVGILLFKNITLGLIGFAIIFGSTAEFWLGSQFKIDEKGVSVRTGASFSVLEWANVKRVVRDSNGIKLTPLENAGTMDAFRGVYLRYGKDNKDSIERAVLTFGKISDFDVVNGTDGRGDGSPSPESGD